MRFETSGKGLRGAFDRISSGCLNHCHAKAHYRDIPEYYLQVVYASLCDHFYQCGSYHLFERHTSSSSCKTPPTHKMLICIIIRP